MATITPPQLSNALTSSIPSFPLPHTTFLTQILATSRPNLPLTTLTATAKHRLLSSDLTTPQILASSNPSFPPSLSSPALPATTLRADTCVQVLDIEDVSKSKWEQIQTLEMERKGEFTKGREVIRVVPGEAEEASTAATQVPPGGTAAVMKSWGPHKLLLQDLKGQTVWGLELRGVEKVGMPPVMSIGCKVVLRNGCKVQRGMMLLEPASVNVLGGKIEGLDKVWREGREQRLRDAVGDERRGED